MKSDIDDEVEELASELFNAYTAEVMYQDDTMLVEAYDSVDEKTKKYYRAMAKHVLASFRPDAMWICDHIGSLGSMCDKILSEIDRLLCRKTRRALLWHLDMVFTLRSKELERRINDETY